MMDITKPVTEIEKAQLFDACRTAVTDRAMLTEAGVLLLRRVLFQLSLQEHRLKAAGKLFDALQGLRDEFPPLPDDWPRRPFYWRGWLSERIHALPGEGPVPVLTDHPEVATLTVSGPLGRTYPLTDDGLKAFLGDFAGGTLKRWAEAAPSNPEAPDGGRPDTA